MLHDLMKLIFDTTGCPCSNFTMEAKDPTDIKFYPVTSSPEISSSFDIYTTTLKIIDGGEYFSSTFKLNDATDCVYYMTCRMLAYEHRLQKETLQWLIDRTRNVIKRSPLMSTISSDVTFGLIYRSEEYKMNDYPPMKNLSSFTELLPHISVENKTGKDRTMFICPIIRKKGLVRPVFLNFTYEELKTRFPQRMNSMGQPDSFYYDILKENIENNTLEMLTNTQMRYHNRLSNIYTFTPAFYNNESYWIVIKEDRLLSEEEKFALRYGSLSLPVPPLTCQSQQQ
jgi:hypothetical protein